MRKAIVLGMVLGLFLIGNQDADAQKKKVKPIATPIVTEFDTSVSKLPPNFKGDNDRIKAICEALPVSYPKDYAILNIKIPKKQIKQGDFETDAEFEMRKASALAKLKTYAFSSTGTEKYGYPDAKPWIVYDIGESAFHIRLDTVDVRDERRVKKGRYIGQNAFGVKKVVDIAEGTFYEATISVDLKVVLPIPIEAAKAIKNDLRVLTIAKPGGVWYKWDYSGATLDSPSDFTMHTYTLVDNLDRPYEEETYALWKEMIPDNAILKPIPAIDVWIYNYKSGDILYKRSDELKKAAMKAEQEQKEQQRKIDEDEKTRGGI